MREMPEDIEKEGCVQWGLVHVNLLKEQCPEASSEREQDT